jgi:Porin PorA
VRRWLGLGLVALGAFLLGCAGMLRWYAAPLAARVPLDPEVTVTLAGTGRAYDLASGAALSGPLTERIAVHSGDGPAGVAVWDVSRRLSRPDGVLVRLDDERVALDRRTAASVACCGEHPPHAGLTYLFPAGVARADQPLYDPATGRTVPARYVGQDTVAGLPTFRFDQFVPDTDLGVRPLPGAPSLAGAGGAETSGRLRVAAQRTFWVEPTSGMIVRMVERRREQLARTGGGAVVLLDAELRTDADSVARLARLAGDRRNLLDALRGAAPLALCIAGLTVLVAGVGYLTATAGRAPEPDTATFVAERQ